MPGDGRTLTPDPGPAKFGCSGAGSAELEKVQLEELGDEDLVGLFLGCAEEPDRRAAHLYFETIVGRYRWLINHVIRNSRFKFPAWDSADDAISRTIFKVYRGLPQWRKQGKLSSFIARIATSELIDTIRRVDRDKSWDSHAAAADADSEQASPIDLAASPGPSPEEQAALSEQRNIVSRLLEDVCRDWKDSVIVNEYIINSGAAKEIADKYGMTEDLIYQRARRLRVRLVKWLEERGIRSADQLGAGHSRVLHA
ncbi:MAG TPA: sigma-70 family RNA polymerase sigma factor [Blastocatellia bacterium]|nr:sigma-70 family RNA polymerase sigma factor [Blastocatellia bacterium]